MSACIYFHHFCPLVSNCVHLCPIVSTCDHFRPFSSTGVQLRTCVSNCVHLCPLVSTCVRLCLPHRRERNLVLPLPFISDQVCQAEVKINSKLPGFQPRIKIVTNEVNTFPLVMMNFVFIVIGAKDLFKLITRAKAR